MPPSTFHDLPTEGLPGRSIATPTGPAPCHAARMAFGAEKGRCDGRWSPRGWVFLRQGEVQGVGGGPEIRDLSLRLVPEDFGRAFGRLGYFSLQEVLLRRRRARRLPFFRRG